LHIRLGSGLWLVNLLSWFLIATILLFPENPVRIVLGIPFVLFFPGYALITALIPKKEGMSGIERLALSFGLSIALVILTGLGLNYTPFGIRLNPIMFSMAGVILVLSVIAWLRMRRLPLEERFEVSYNLSIAFWKTGSLWDKVLSVILVIAVLGSIGAVAYTIARPKPGEEFTEFYILGAEGKAADYPSRITRGDTATVTGGIVNNFQETNTYRIEISVDGTKSSGAGPIELAPEGKWEGALSFTPQATGENQKVEFRLFKNTEAEASESLHIWVDVTD